jgi:hypothetical protein
LCGNIHRWGLVGWAWSDSILQQLSKKNEWSVKDKNRKFFETRRNAGSATWRTRRDESKHAQ